MSRMSVVYIAGPYRSPDGGVNGIHENIERARAVALKWWRAGYAVICPHLNTAFMDGACPDEVWLQGDLEIMSRCDIVIFLPGWETSKGACIEKAAAEQLGIMRIILYGDPPEAGKDGADD